MGFDMIDLGFSKKISFEEGEALLKSFLPSVFVFDVYESSNLENPCSIGISLTQHEDLQCDFPSLLTIYGSSKCEQELHQKIIISLASHASLFFNCRVICDGTGFGDDNSPYWSLIFDNSKVFLADDSHTIYADGSGGLVKIVRELQLPANPIIDYAEHFISHKT